MNFFPVHGMRIVLWPIALWAIGYVFFTPWAWSDTALKSSEPTLSVSVEKSAALVDRKDPGEAPDVARTHCHPQDGDQQPPT